MDTSRIRNRKAVIRRAVRHWNPVNVKLNAPSDHYQDDLGFTVDDGGNFNIWKSGPRHIFVEQNRAQIFEYHFSPTVASSLVECDGTGDWNPIALVDLDTGYVENLDEVVFAVRSGRSWELDAEEVSS